MFEEIVQPAVAFAWKGFRDALLSRRLLAISIVLGALLMGTTAALAAVTAGTPPAGTPGAPDPYEVWFGGASGVLVTVAFGLTPFYMPFLSILAASRILQVNQKRGISELSMTKPIPPWGPALGTFAGLFAAIAIPTVAISLGSGLAINLAAGTSADNGFLAAYVGASILLVGLYLLLTLLVGAFTRPEFVAPLMALIWVGFNVVRNTGYYMTARLATVLGAETATTFQAGWADLVTFTGLYHGVLAPAVPQGLAFVITTSPGSLDPTQAAPWAILAWFVGLFLLYALALRRVPTR